MSNLAEGFSNLKQWRILEIVNHCLLLVSAVYTEDTSYFKVSFLSPGEKRTVWFLNRGKAQKTYFLRTCPQGKEKEGGHD